MSGTWVHAWGGHLPRHAVPGGRDMDGDRIYVGRSHHEGDLLAAKVIPGKGGAFVCHGGSEFSRFSDFDVLVGDRYKWMPCAGYGNVPPYAVCTGKTLDGEPLFVGRARHNFSVTVGKVHPSRGFLYIPFGGEEIRKRHYEVLVHV